MANIIVKLDDERYPAGPATIVEVGVIDSVAARKGYADKDGSVPGWLRVWQMSDGDKVGDRVRLA